jgi:hypothetical protein
MTGGISEEAKVRKDILLGMYADFRTHSRHAQTMRSSAVSVMIVVASVLIAVIGNDERVDQDDLPLCAAMILMGLFGLGFVASYTELHKRNRLRAIYLRDKLDREFFGESPTSLRTIIDEADNVHHRNVVYLRSRRMTGSTTRFWLVLPGLVLVTGVILVAVAF